MHVPAHSLPKDRFPWRDIPLTGAALFACFLAVVRASRQSIIIDEAWTYLNYVWRVAPAHWESVSNNHLLNTLLMRCFTTAFGVSHLTVRAPALIGAAIYIAAAYSLAKLLTMDRIVQLAVFVALVFNPFVFDFFTLARGYALALGFLLAAIAVAARCPISRVHTCALSSMCITLSFCANFSFAFIDGMIFLAIGIWAWRAYPSARWRVALACIAPALLVIAVIPSWTLLHWPQGELYVGAKSLAQTFRSVRDASFYEINPHVVNPMMFSLLNAIRPYLLPTLGGICAAQLVLLWIGRFKLRTKESIWRVSLGLLLIGAAAGALVLHWLAFQLFQILLPENRTALFFAPVFTLILAVIATMPAPSIAAIWNRRALLVLIGVMSCLFLACGRITWVREWRRLADVHDIYSLIANCIPESFTVEPVANAEYLPVLNFYRRMYATSRIAEFSGPLEYPKGTRGYVLDYSQDRAFIEAEGLNVIYRGDSTDIVVAVKDAQAVPTSAECTQYPIRHTAEGFADPQDRLISLRPGTYDDTDPAVVYSGRWISDNQFPEAQHSTVSFSSARGAFFRIAFRGQRFTWIYTKASNRGIADVSIDGVHLATVDLFSPTVAWKARSSFAVAMGDHVFEVRVRKEKNPAASDRFVDLDSFVVE